MDEETITVQPKSYAAVQVEERTIYSDFLERNVTLDVYLPLHTEPKEPSLLLLNDGQDLRTMHFANILHRTVSENAIRGLICVAIHCGSDRLNEYGTAYRADYKGKGAKAGLYTKFILTELLPFIKADFQIDAFKEKSFAGFSLGGLSALDIVWNNANEFSKAGVFSGALWWRRHGYDDDSYNEHKDRIMHLQVQKGAYSPGLKFFFECGCLDETADRNNNGIIDSIEDTTDLIEDLKEIGYGEEQIQYLELEDGEHNIETWARALPEFLRWGWGRREVSSQKAG